MLWTTDSTWPDPGLKPGRRGGKAATNCLSYSTVCGQSYIVRQFVRHLFPLHTFARDYNIRYLRDIKSFDRYRIRHNIQGPGLTFQGYTTSHSSYFKMGLFTFLFLFYLTWDSQTHNFIWNKEELPSNIFLSVLSPCVDGIIGDHQCRFRDNRPRNYRFSYNRQTLERNSSTMR
jgi:hypothetical protein